MSQRCATEKLTVERNCNLFACSECHALDQVRSRCPRRPHLDVYIAGYTWNGTDTRKIFPKKAANAHTYIHVVASRLSGRIRLAYAPYIWWVCVVGKTASSCNRRVACQPTVQPGVNTKMSTACTSAHQDEYPKTIGKAAFIYRVRSTEAIKR